MKDNEVDCTRYPEETEKWELLKKNWILPVSPTEHCKWGRVALAESRACDRLRSAGRSQSRKEEEGGKKRKIAKKGEGRGGGP